MTHLGVAVGCQIYGITLLVIMSEMKGHSLGDSLTKSLLFRWETKCGWRKWLPQGNTAEPMGIPGSHYGRVFPLINGSLEPPSEL